MDGSTSRESVADLSGYVYVMLRDDGLRKLGWSVNVRQRRTNLSSATGVRHTIKAIWFVERAVIIEGMVHYSLRSKKVKGYSSIELYSLSLDELCRAVEAAITHIDEQYPEAAKLGTKPGARHLGMSVSGFIKALTRVRGRETQNGR